MKVLLFLFAISCYAGEFRTVGNTIYGSNGSDNYVIRSVGSTTYIEKHNTKTGKKTNTYCRQLGATVYCN